MNLFTELREGLLIALEALRANKLRAGLTTLGIVIGIVTVTLMGTAIEGLNAAFLRSISAIGADVLFVSKYPWFGEEPWWKVRNRRDLLLQDGRALRAQQQFSDAVSIEAGWRKNVKFQDRTATGITIIGNNEDGAIIAGMTMREGRWFTTAEVGGARPVCVMGADLATSFFRYDTPLGKKVRVDETSYEVIGVIEKRGKFMGMESLDNQVHVPITRFVTDHQMRPGVTIRLKVRDMKQLDEAREELRGVMRRVRRIDPGKDDDFSINAQEAFVKMSKRVSTVIAGVGLFITGLSLAVGGIGIMNIMFVSVAERTREIGIRKAIGAKRRTILLQFLIEAATICLFGGLLGLGIAWPVSLMINQFLPTSMSLPIVGLALGVSVLTGVVAGFLPAWRAARMNPVDALRAE
ncbi:MAG: FtsX-like permease family protein [Verrucomicrobia bacterium]|nr:FtsX-like permease family protein [Verrucomicrobiota bacterium]